MKLRPSIPEQTILALRTLTACVDDDLSSRRGDPLMAGPGHQRWVDPAAGRPSPRHTILPIPDKGPFSVGFDELFVRASASVQARPDLVEGMEALQDPPDLGQVIAGQKEVLAAVVDTSFTRCVAVAARLHEMLVEQLAAERPADLGRLESLVASRSMRANSKGWHLSDIDNAQVALLQDAVSGAQGQREFRTLHTEWEVQRREVLTGLGSAMVSVAVAALNDALAADAAPRMTVKSYDGLRETVTTDRIVVTEAYLQLERMLRGRNEGSFGVAGPRGAGKSTLVRFFASTPGVRWPGEDHPAGRKRLGVVVSAPVTYEPREFILHLYAELCSAVLGDRQVPLRPVWTRRTTPALGIPRFMVKTALATLGAAALTGATGLLAVAAWRRPPWTWHPLTDAGALLVLVAALTFGVLLQSSPPKYRRRPALRKRRARLASRKDRARLAAPMPEGRPLRGAIVSATAVAGVVLMFAAEDAAGSRAVVLASAALVALGYPAARFARLIHHNELQSLSASSPFAIEGRGVARDRLSELAFDHLRRIRFQQSLSLERSVAVKAATGGAGLDVGGKRGETWQERPKTYPEIVADLRAFLAAAAEQFVVVVGVDELDKLRSHEDVEAFLNDIKGVFGTPGCFFLVSVSEDAAAGFERRGVPFRDVFDSAFDDVISVQHLDLRSARKILHGLLLGWTEPFVGLCYVLSGGLPRDLRRIARELVSHRDEADGIELGTAALAMSRRELGARIRAIRHELMRDPFDPAMIDLLTRVADLRPATVTRTDLMRWHDELTAWASSATPPGEPAPTAVRLCSELAALSLLAATVLAFFDQDSNPDRIREAERPDVGARSLAVLAVARRTLAQSPGLSLAYTGRFRAAWGL
ncbi:hypothetical protein [Amycolatopsis sp. lyj-109]|uniref:hypothetical protein n=1 Tax=Amycolatopsis sp. lyj-109 TaxID=2789287 RepID=UPI003978ECD2